MFWAAAFTSSTDFTTLTPPALPRPPAWIWAFTTQTLPPSFLRGLHRLFRRIGDVARRRRDAVLTDQRLGLILVNVHAVFIPRSEAKTSSAGIISVHRVGFSCPGLWQGWSTFPKASDGDNRRNAVVQQAALYHLDRRVQAN